MEELIEILRKGNYSCVVKNGSDIRMFTQRGVADLYSLLKHSADFLKGAMVADKVIGKAAAALIILGRVKKLYAEVISVPAIILLRNAGVEVDFQRLVPYIRNRSNDDWCPLETICCKDKTAEDVLPKVENFLISMGKRMA